MGHVVQIYNLQQPSFKSLDGLADGEFNRAIVWPVGTATHNIMAHALGRLIENRRFVR